MTYSNWMVAELPTVFGRRIGDDGTTEHDVVTVSDSETSRVVRVLAAVLCLVDAQTCGAVDDRSN